MEREEPSEMAHRSSASNSTSHRKVQGSKRRKSSENENNYPSRVLTFGFPFSGQPDIVRSLQKDDFYSNHVIFNNLKDLSNWYFGQRFTTRFEKEIQLIGNIIYYGATTCTEQPTLGEEYCDLLQVQLKPKDQTTKKQETTPQQQHSKTFYIVKSSLTSRLQFVTYELLIPYLFDRGASQWLSHLHHSNGFSEKIRTYLHTLKEFIQFIFRFNLAAFYVHGKYLQVSKRFAGIRYIYTGKTDGDSYKRPNFVLLSLLIMIQQVVSAVLFVKGQISQYFSRKKESLQKDNNQIIYGGVEYSEKDIEARNETEFKCSLCLERRVKTTATQCGHLYCWDCITECVANSKEPKCPICRQSVNLQSLSRLHCYDSIMVVSSRGQQTNE